MMHFVVTPEKGDSVRLTPDQLNEQLLGRVNKIRKPELEELAVSLGQFTSSSGLLLNRPMAELFYLAMMVGYYYRVFLTNNKVEVEAGESK